MLHSSCLLNDSLPYGAPSSPGRPWVVVRTYHHTHVEFWRALLDGTREPLQFGGESAAVHFVGARARRRGAWVASSFCMWTVIGVTIHYLDLRALQLIPTEGECHSSMDCPLASSRRGLFVSPPCTVCDISHARCARVSSNGLNLVACTFWRRSTYWLYKSLKMLWVMLAYYNSLTTLDSHVGSTLMNMGRSISDSSLALDLNSACPNPNFISDSDSRRPRHSPQHLAAQEDRDARCIRKAPPRSAPSAKWR